MTEPDKKKLRKHSGSHYTPPSLVACLIGSALDPVIDDALAKADPQAALLALTVCDPACGAGIFPLMAERRLAHVLASLRLGRGDPRAPATGGMRDSADVLKSLEPDLPLGELRRARRDVATRCIYAVDLNPLAVDFTRLTLSLDALCGVTSNPFLAHHVKCGNGIIGATPALIDGGIPDDAFKPIEGDDPAVVRALKARNKAERLAATAVGGGSDGALW